MPRFAIISHNASGCLVLSSPASAVEHKELVLLVSQAIRFVVQRSVHLIGDRFAGFHLSNHSIRAGSHPQAAIGYSGIGCRINLTVNYIECVVGIVIHLLPLFATTAVQGVVNQHIQLAACLRNLLYMAVEWQRNLCPIRVVDYIIGKRSSIEGGIAGSIDSLFAERDAIDRNLCCFRPDEIGIDELAFADVEGLNTIIHRHESEAVFEDDGVAKFAECSIFVIQVRDVMELSVAEQIHLSVGVHYHQRLHRFKPADACDVCTMHAVLVAIGANLFRLHINGKERT